jgi:hypothetical protein
MIALVTNRMNKMIDAIWPEFGINPEGPPTSEVQKFFDILRALKKLLYEHATISVPAFMTHLIIIKSKIAFSNNCYKGCEEYSHWVDDRWMHALQFVCGIVLMLNYLCYFVQSSTYSLLEI